MTQNIYNTIKEHFTPSRVNQIAQLFDEDKVCVSKSVDTIIAGLLTIVQKEGNTGQVRELLQEAGNLKLLEEVGAICEECPTQDQQRIGDGFLQTLLGDKAADFTDPIANQTGVPKPAVNQLVNMLAPVTAGVLGEKMVNDKITLTQLLDEISQQKASYVKLLPIGLINTFGLSVLVSAPTPKAVNTVAPAETKPEPKKKKRGWVTWLIVALIIVLILLLWLA